MPAKRLEEVVRLQDELITGLRHALAGALEDLAAARAVTDALRAEVAVAARLLRDESAQMSRLIPPGLLDGPLAEHRPHEDDRDRPVNERAPD